MELYLLRHGIAENQRPGESDSLRALTAEGREKLDSVLKTARHARVEPSLILSSTYVRAIQTAEAAAKALKCTEPVIQSPTFTPDARPEAAWKELRDYQGQRAVLLASHEPFLGQFVAYLLAAPSLRVDVRKASLIRIDLDTFRPVPHGTLRWMLTPSVSPAQ